MTEILAFEPELEPRPQQAWPEAIMLFNEMFARLCNRLPQEELTEEDYQLLTDDEYNELTGCFGEFKELISRDKESFWRPHDPTPRHKLSRADKAEENKYHDEIALLQLQIDLKGPMDKIYHFWEKVYRLKTARAKEEQRKLEEQAEAVRKEKEKADETARETARKEKEKAEEVAKEERRNQAEKVALGAILFNREISKGLPKDAAICFADFVVEVLDEIIPLITDKEFSYVGFDMVLNTYLTDDVDKAQVGKYKQIIWEWLHICKTSGEGYSRVISDDMFELKKLIVKAFQAKREEVRKLEEQAEAVRIRKERAEAFKHVYSDQLKIDAQRYLENDEQGKLLTAAYQAIDGYLKGGDSYLNSYESPFDYRWFIKKINDKKNEELREINYKKKQEQIRLDAIAQAQSFGPRLDQGLRELEGKLSPKKKDPIEIFKKWCSNNGEKRYLGESFADILDTGDRKKNWTQSHIPAAEEALGENLIPEELQDFILTESEATPFLLPSATYLHCGVPCLVFSFDVFSVVMIKVSARAGKKEFNGIPFNFLTDLLEPKLLGFYHITIYPSKAHFWQSVPISLFHALIDGKAHAPGQGITIKVRKNLFAEYEVKKFKEDMCTIPISFERYCHTPGIIEKMREVGIIEERTAEMLELPQPISINNKESKSKKKKAFKLFDEGKGPTSPEVKALGLNYKVCRNYYALWKKEHKS